MTPELFLVCALVAAVAGSPAGRVQRSPEEDSASSSSSEELEIFRFLNKAYKKTKDTVTDAVDKIQHSEVYQNTKEGLTNIGDKMKEVSDNIKNSDTFQNMKTTIGDAASNIKDKVKETLDDIKDHSLVTSPNPLT